MDSGFRHYLCKHPGGAIRAVLYAQMVAVVYVCLLGLLESHRMEIGTLQSNF
jgi:hypothetical protein